MTIPTMIALGFFVGVPALFIGVEIARRLAGRVTVELPDGPIVEPGGTISGVAVLAPSRRSQVAVANARLLCTTRERRSRGPHLYEQSLELGRDLQAHVDEPLRLEFTFTLPAELDRKPLGELSDWLEETGRGGTATALNGLIGGAVGALTEAAGASPGTKDPLPGMERRGDVEYELRNPEGDPRYGAVWLVEVQCDVGALELTGAERVRVVHPAE